MKKIEELQSYILNISTKFGIYWFIYKKDMANVLSSY